MVNGFVTGAHFRTIKPLTGYPFNASTDLHQVYRAASEKTSLFIETEAVYLHHQDNIYKFIPL